MKKVNLIIILGLVYLFTLLSFYIYIQGDKFQVKKADEKDTEELQKWFAVQTRAATYNFAKDQITDSTNIPMPMMQLAKKGPRIGMYVHDIHGVPNWEKELDYLKALVAQNKGLEQPFFLTNNLHGRELRIIKKEYAIPFPIYSYCFTFERRDIFYLALQHRPFFFILNPDGMVSSIVFPDDAIRPLMTNYFR